MNNDPLETPDTEPVEDDDGGQRMEMMTGEGENIPQTQATKQSPGTDRRGHPAESDALGEPIEEDDDDLGEPLEEDDSGEPLEEDEEYDGEKEELLEEASKEIKEEPKDDSKSAGGEPPVDWFEPVEDDEDDSVGRNAEEESLAGESERSESVWGSEVAFKKFYKLQVPRRRRSHPDEGWVLWPALGDGWKRKEVVRRSGCSVGQKDVYYMSPKGERVRSRVELCTMLDGVLDLTSFDYKSGAFYNGEGAPTRVRTRVRRKMRERSSSESSWMERGEGADTPDSHHRLTPSQGLRNLHSNQTSFSSYTAALRSSNQDAHDEDQPEYKIRLPLPSSSRSIPLPSINGAVASKDNCLVCAKCGISFTGTWYDKQRKRPCCPTCWASKTKEHPMIRLRKWIPCGQCVGCHNTVNCGQCANCKHGLQSPESRKRICRKRRCLCPIRKAPSLGAFVPKRSHNDMSDTFDDSMSFQSEIADSQNMSFKSSDTENLSLNVDLDDDDDMSTDDDDDWHKKRKRRACGECKACLCRKDCGTCDFCIDKPKFGGSNKKRQKCRLRQCQRQAMMGQGDYHSDNPLLPGRPRPHYTYSRKSSLKKSKALDLSDNDDDDSQPQAMSWSSEPAGASKPPHDNNVINHQSSMQLNTSTTGVLNGLPERVPNLSNHNSSHLDQVSKRDGDKSPQSTVDHQPVDEEEEEDELPLITQIFSLADNPPVSGTNMENELMQLLKSLRATALPILWYAIMVEGPQLQLIQCAKQSNMTDTMVLIDPGFSYQVTVQRQPLLPTHSLYEDYPSRLSSVTEVVNLILDLEKYIVCHGLPAIEPLKRDDPITLERAPTCDFLVKKNVRICSNCRALRG